MTHLEILIRLTKAEVRTLTHQRRACGIWAAFLYGIVLLTMLRADGTYGQIQIFTVAIFTLTALAWVIRAHHAHLLLEVSKARKEELDAILDQDDGGTTIYSSGDIFNLNTAGMPADVSGEISRALRREGMKRQGSQHD